MKRLLTLTLAGVFLLTIGLGCGQPVRRKVRPRLQGRVTNPTRVAPTPSAGTSSAGVRLTALGGVLKVFATSPTGKIFSADVGSDGVFAVEVDEKIQYIINFGRDLDTDGDLDTLEGAVSVADGSTRGTTQLIGAPEEATVELGNLALPSTGTFLMASSLDLKTLDTDGDGTKDFSDSDADGNNKEDGLDEVAILGTDKDLIPSWFDNDDNNDGVVDTVFTNDSDHDGITDSLDQEITQIALEIGAILIDGVADADRDGVADPTDTDDANQDIHRLMEQLVE